MTLHNALLVAALVCFAVGAIGRWPPINMTALGLVFCVLSVWF